MKEHPQTIVLGCHEREDDHLLLAYSRISLQAGVALGFCASDVQIIGSTSGYHLPRVVRAVGYFVIPPQAAKHLGPILIRNDARVTALDKVFWLLPKHEHIRNLR